MKTANDLFDRIYSLREKGRHDTQFGILYIRIYTLCSTETNMEFSVGLDEYAVDINFVAQFRDGEFCSFDIYPHARDKAEAYHVSWKAAQTFQELVEICPEGKNIQFIIGALSRMLDKEGEETI